MKEFIKNEMMVHIPLCSHKEPKNILIIGDDSNKYDTDIYDDKGFTGTGTRESNLKTNFDNGVTVEFWLKKDSFDASKTEKEVIFDLWNSSGLPEYYQ